MLATTTDPIPGIYPLIVHRDPLQTGNGKDNLGMGYTEHGEQFMLKAGGAIGVAEFVGAKVADACGVPACQPTIVTMEDLSGWRHVFGSRIESGRKKFDQSLVAEWQAIMANCSNPKAFTAILAIDLVLGNDDRHWNNCLIQEVPDLTGAATFRVRTLDFSRSWPTCHPPQHPLNHNSANTWSAIRHWPLLGIEFDRQVFRDTCAKIGMLNERWLKGAVLQQITGVFLTSAQATAYCDWWAQCLRAQVIETIQVMETGVWP